MVRFKARPRRLVSRSLCFLKNERDSGWFSSIRIGKNPAKDGVAGAEKSLKLTACKFTIKYSRAA